MVKYKKGVVLMLQNLKNFLIAFLTGLIVFGLCAILVLSTISGGTTDNEVSADESIVTETAAD